MRMIYFLLLMRSLLLFYKRLATFHQLVALQQQIIIAIQIPKWVVDENVNNEKQKGW